METSFINVQRGRGSRKWLSRDQLMYPGPINGPMNEQDIRSYFRTYRSFLGKEQYVYLPQPGSNIIILNCQERIDLIRSWSSEPANQQWADELQQALDEHGDIFGYEVEYVDAVLELVPGQADQRAVPLLAGKTKDGRLIVNAHEGTYYNVIDRFTRLQPNDENPVDFPRLWFMEDPEVVADNNEINVFPLLPQQYTTDPVSGGLDVLDGNAVLARRQAVRQQLTQPHQRQSLADVLRPRQ